MAVLPSMGLIVTTRVARSVDEGIQCGIGLDFRLEFKPLEVPEDFLRVSAATIVDRGCQELRARQIEHLLREEDG